MAKTRENVVINDTSTGYLFDVNVYGLIFSMGTKLYTFCKQNNALTISRCSAYLQHIIDSQFHIK